VRDGGGKGGTEEAENVELRKSGTDEVGAREGAECGMKNVERWKRGTERRRPENLELRESGTEGGADRDGARCGGLCG
jgi:hypothetical protein